MGDRSVFFTLISLLLLALFGIGVSGKAKQDQLDKGCREAGGALVGEICIIRNDCNAVGKPGEPK